MQTYTVKIEYQPSVYCPRVKRVEDVLVTVGELPGADLKDWTLVDLWGARDIIPVSLRILSYKRLDTGQSN